MMPTGEKMPSYEIMTPGTGEITEKKSRFIGSICHVTSEEEAMAFVAAKKKEYYDARHNCWAYVIGSSSDASSPVTRSSDDGEPSGTAGRPILDVMTGRGVVNAALVVTRYFGGVLLGTGGLVRAYSACASECIDHSSLAESRMGIPLTISVDYGNVGRIQHLIAERDLFLKDTVYDADVRFICMVDPDECDGISTLITNETSGTAVLSQGEPESYILPV